MDGEVAGVSDRKPLTGYIVFASGRFPTSFSGSGVGINLDAQPCCPAIR
jgi:hypothetical protein